MLSEKQLSQFKKQLEEMKEKTEKELAGYVQNQDQSSSDYEGELSSVSDHPGDLGTVQHEREKDQTFYEQSKEKLMEINDALKRIDEGTYGKSEKSGEPIPMERLKAMPTARFTVEEAEEERG
ncbi:TraR/DksA C4-type zinc finger protein [Halobacillus andaensis]|uniref:TraR/DksA C4-type zinc finger protein n=1 Tax=Halobacillus andaensis TaxID=1176239 RepID=UPI003D70DCFA